VHTSAPDATPISASHNFVSLIGYDQGVAGQGFGKHTVQKAKIDVQLGEDLTDSLRV
jgi:hypothetical protein